MFLAIKVSKPWMGYPKKHKMPTVFLSIFLRRFECLKLAMDKKMDSKWKLEAYSFPVILHIHP